MLYDFSVDPNFAIDDVSAALSRAEVLSTLSMGDLIKIARVLKVAREVRTSVEKVQNIPHLTDVLGGIFVNKAFEDDVSKAILSETEMNDNASPELRSIRQKIRRINDNIRSKLNEYVTSPVYGKYLQDNIITVRGDRYVIPVRAECRGNVSGIVHDQSASGQTVYVEPQQIVEMNNDLKTQLLSEAAEIEKILREFTFRVSADAAGINVTKYKYVATVCGCALCGLASTVYLFMFSGGGGLWATTNNIEAIGWLAVALVIFSTWKPVHLIWGSYLFGLLYWAYNYAPAVFKISIPVQLWQMLPYVVTIVVLILTSMRKKRENQPPQGLGVPYFREER